MYTIYGIGVITDCPGEVGNCVVAERSFIFEDQVHFARLSGDQNPLHVDPIWAATVFPGEVVVHGMHALLWGIESTWPGGRFASLSATFIRPVLLGEPVTAKLDGDMLSIMVRGELMVTARLGLAGDSPPAPSVGAGGRAGGGEQEWAGRRGTVLLPADGGPLADVFPRLAAGQGADGLRGLAGLSTLVGMKCPGLCGIFTGFSVTFGVAADTLTYRVTRFDRRFSRITMVVEGPLNGTVEAVVGRPEPSPPTNADLLELVKSGEFAGERPLIVGGSSGLGAVTALLLAAGGSHPVISYHRSKQAAEHIAARIDALGAACDVISLDARNPAEGLAALAALSWNGTHAYYFASPRIFRRRVELYQQKDLRDFTQFYIDGFYDLVRGLMHDRGQTPLTIFYPSSTAVADVSADLFEYALSKHAGEMLCRRLEKKYKQLSIIVERLPRIDTRQTHAFLQVPALAPHSAMLPVIRRVHQRSLS